MDQQIGSPKGTFAERAFDALERTSYVVARTEAEKEAIYRLRYRAYLKEGAIEPNETRMLRDAFDEQPNVCSIAMRYDDHLVGAIRINMISRNERRSSAGVTFPDLLAPYLDAGEFICDPNRFVAEPAIADRIPELPYLVSRMAIISALHFGARYGLATPRAEHYAFYRRVLLAQTLSTPVMYPGLTKAIGLMIQETAVAAAYVQTRYPFMAPRPNEGKDVFGDLDLRCPADVG
jgi:N-acyl-L-homoserine lactone synthetase